MKSKNQTGIISLAVPVVIIVMIAVAGVGYYVYQSKHKKPSNSSTNHNTSSSTVTSYTGKVTKVDCSKAAIGCSEYVLKTSDNKSFNLSDGNLDKYVNQTVNVKGQINKGTSTSTIMVSSIEMAPTHDNPAQGTLNGRVVCVQKVDEQPCASTLSVSYAKSTNPGESTSNLAVTIKTDAAGNFSKDLNPGSYDIHSDPKAGYPVIVPISNPITITAGQTTTIKITYMDGTR